MESRWVYRGIEEAAETGRFEDSGYPHSSLSRFLRYNYRTYRDLIHRVSYKFCAVSSLLSRPDMKFDAALDLHQELMEDLESAIPYVGSRKRRETSKLEEERSNLVSLFNKVLPELERLGQEYAKASEDAEKAEGHDPDKIDI